MILVSNGCSHTAGAELESSTQGECYEKAWPKHLADSLGYEHINLSMSGASTNRVLRTTYEFIHDYIIQGKDLKKLFIVILWPGIFRTELYIEGKSTSYNYDHYWTPMLVANAEQYKTEYLPIHYHYFKSWVTNTTPYQATCEYYMTITNLQNLLHRYGIKYLFMDAANSGLSMSVKVNRYKIHIDKRYYEGLDNPENCYTSLCRDYNQKISTYSVDSGCNSHYDEDAHIWFAKYIENIINKRNIL